MWNPWQWNFTPLLRRIKIRMTICIIIMFNQHRPLIQILMVIERLPLLDRRYMLAMPLVKCRIPEVVYLLWQTALRVQVWIFVNSVVSQVWSNLLSTNIYVLYVCWQNIGLTMAWAFLKLILTVFKNVLTLTSLKVSQRLQTFSVLFADLSYSRSQLWLTDYLNIVVLIGLIHLVLARKLRFIFVAFARHLALVGFNVDGFQALEAGERGFLGWAQVWRVV